MRSIHSLNIWPNDDETSPLFEPLFDKLEHHIGVLSATEAKEISAYMDFFTDSGGWLSYPIDPVDKKTIVEQNGGEDDQYRWSGILHHLIKQYRVDPPMEFRVHVREKLSSVQDLAALAAELNQPVKRRSPKLLREREWRRLKAEGGVKAAWVLYP